MKSRSPFWQLVLASSLFFGFACFEIPTTPIVLSPGNGQVIRDAASFQVEVEADASSYDLDTLEVLLNGSPLSLSKGSKRHIASLPPASVLASGNQIVVSAVRIPDGVLRASSVEFSLEELPPDVVFSEDFVVNPPPVETADLEVLDTEALRQNAILRVRFRQGFDAPKKIPYRVDEQTVFILADDGLLDDELAGDGLFTARVDFDYEEYALRRTFDVLAASSSGAEELALKFDGRQVADSSATSFGSVMPAAISPTSKWIKLVPPIPLPVTIDAERALMIRDLSVVADPSRTFDPCDTDGDGLMGNPNGPWTFKTLMSEMANTSATGLSLDQFVRNWLAGWGQNFDALHGGSVSGDWIVNNDVVPHREGGLISNIVNPWPKTSAGTLDMDQAPFRLLAIVNRVDLRDAVGYGSSTSTAGELRFVFGLLDMTSCSPDRMTAIFEYTVHANSCGDVLSYAQDWEDLDQLFPPFPAMPGYLAHLQSITDPVTTAGAAPLEPNGSSIGQLRTSEVVMGFPWEMREFTLQPIPFGTGPGQNVLRMETTKQTPDRDFTVDPAFQPILTNFINSNLSDICDEAHVVPNTWAGFPFMAGRADFFPDSHFWAPGIAGFPAGGCTNDDIRFNFSVNTCSGCHGGDTIDPAADPPFYHVHPDTPPGLPVELSRFLTGTGASPIPDPSPIGGIPRKFADLDRRATDLQDLLATGCLKLTVASSVHVSAVH